MATIVPISNLPSAISTDGTEVLPIVQSTTTKKFPLSSVMTDVSYISGFCDNLDSDVTFLSGGIDNLENDVTYLSGAIDTNQSRVTLTGFFNDLASQASGNDFMEWTSNSTGNLSVPAIRLVQNLKLTKIAFVWLGDSALQIGGGEKLDFTVRKLTPGATSHIENYTQVGNIMFTLDSSDNNTNPQKTITLASPITLSESDMIAVIAAETGAITPNNGELSMTFLFDII